MKIKTSELEGIALNWVAAKCEYPRLKWGKTIGLHHASPQIVIPELPEPECYYNPSTDWVQGGPIIEREGISIARLDPTTEEDTNFWVAHIDGIYCRYGPTPLIAAMRCYVVSKLGVGDEVDVPEELILLGETK
jgi:hypothetical protein